MASGEQSAAMPPEVGEHPLFSGGTVGIMTADKPKFPTRHKGGNSDLQAHLKSMGLKHEPLKGHYDEPENSFLVHNPTRAQMYELGHRFGQESVIFSEGGRHQLLYTHGPHQNHYVTTTEPHFSFFAEKPGNHYSAVPGGNGFFRLNFDFSRHLPMEIHRPQNPNLSPEQQAPTRKSEMSTVTIPELRSALLERLKKTEAQLIELAKIELPGQNPNMPQAVAPNLNAAPQSPVGSGNEVPVGQLGPEGQAQMETGGGNCPLCGQPDMPGKCLCLQTHGGPAAAGAPQPLALSEKLGKVAPPGREKQVKALKPKVGTESAFKIAWSSYDKKAKAARKNFLDKGEAPVVPEGLNMGEVQKNAAMGYGQGAPGAVKPSAPALPTNKSEGLCKTCGKMAKMCKCMSKADFVDPKGKKSSNSDVNKGPPDAAGIKELPRGGSSGPVKPNSFAVKKAEPPMAKPPSGKNPATMTPAAKPAAPTAAPKTGAVPKPAAPKAGLMGKAEEVTKAALAVAPKAQMQQHGLMAGSKAAAGAAPTSPLAGPRQPLQHPAQMGRANAMQSALGGAFQPKGPVHSGLELARPKAPSMGIQKSEGCPFCGRPDHWGDCE